MRKLLAACLAIVMALTLAVPALAAGEADVSIIGGADGPTMISVTPFTLQPPTQEQIDAYLTARGGTPGQINVMVDGKCVPFDRVYPALISGRTMVPLRGVLEFLGARVDYDAATRTATVTGEAVSFTHVIGTDKITLGEGGGELTMDVASAIQNGSTLVPLRFFSQALGYDVFWDKDYRTAIVIDKAGFVADFDKSFTILNGYMAEQYKALDLSKPLGGDVTFSADVKVIDSINGDQTYRISGDFDMAMDEKAMNLSGKLELGDMMKLWDAVVLPLTGEVWFTDELEGLTELMAQYTQLMGQMKTMTFGGAIYEVFSMMGLYNSVLGYDALTQLAQFYQQMMGDDTWTKSGTTYKWHFGEKEFEKLMENMSGEKVSLAEAGITKYTIDMTLRQNGGMDMSMEMAGEGIKLTMKGSGAASKSSFTGSLQVQNICDVSFKIDTATRTGGQTLQTPPAGASVLSEADLQKAA
ncbi:MAG: copper amine oxidase N-terminal domain-containing protein [Oscillospiraceae bacterium]|nr:copper amine oxidase N-terminal domain-containing protein [Oscillospiraceae bacterium]